LNILNTLGLSTDFLGVFLLGVDLVRVQCGLKTDARERLERFNELVETNAVLQNYAQDLRRSGDWREHEYDEGRMTPIGGFDHEAARESFQASVDLSASVGDTLSALATTLAASHETDARNADSSLKYSYFGLALVLCGFAMQVASQFVELDVAFLMKLL
jgi:hypothetical protein